MTNILGISAFYHDSAAALVCGTDIVAAAQEERFSRKKHDPRFPRDAISYCLEEAFLEADEIDCVAFYDSTAATLDRVMRNAVTIAPDGKAGFAAAMRSCLGDKLALRKDLKGVLGAERPLWYVDHHLSHAASAFYPSPFETAAILTVDGVGEHSTLSIGFGSGRDIELVTEILYPHSLGLLYSAMTAYCGFKVNSGEYKLMGLAPYGTPKFASLIEDRLIDIKEDGSFALNMDYFEFPAGERMTGEAFAELFGGPPRAPEADLTSRHMDLAASIQAVTEKAMLRLARQAVRVTGARNLTMAGGVALNCVANGKIRQRHIADDIWIQPAAGDAGGALGAALYAAHAGFGAPRSGTARDRQKGSYLGRAYGSDTIRAVLERHDIVFQEAESVGQRNRDIAAALADGAVVGHFSGRMEFGPRALGARSILGDPRDPSMQSKMNLRVKFREGFRPFAPMIKCDRVGEYFDFAGESPYMLFVAPVAEERRLPFDISERRAGTEDLIEIVNCPRSDIPAVTHVDFSARLQTVHPHDNPAVYDLLDQFDRLTGCPLLVNTSFNVRGEPIVESPLDALRCFLRTGIDLLVIENFLVWKHRQPADAADWAREKEFELD